MFANKILYNTNKDYYIKQFTSNIWLHEKRNFKKLKLKFYLVMKF